MLEVPKADVWSHWTTLNVRLASRPCRIVSGFVLDSLCVSPHSFMPKSAPARWARLVLTSLGPGVITGAADDDPSGIGTYSVAGAQLGTKLLWTALVPGR
jgi:hypothetical protein